MLDRFIGERRHREPVGTRHGHGRLMFRMKSAILVVACLIGILAEHATGDSGSTNAYARWKNGPQSDPSFFPIGVWLQNPGNAEKFKAAGFNLYVGLWKGPTEEQLVALEKANMPVICDQNEVGLADKNRAIIVGWMHGDEPDNAQPVIDPKTGKKGWGPCIPPSRVVADYKRMQAVDPTRPILLNLGQGVANDQWHGRGSGAKLADYETYVQGGDIVSFDVYPVVGINKADGENYLWYVAKGVDRLRKWSGGRKIVWNCIECTHISSPHKATPQQVKAEVWMSLIHGSTGLIYFVHQFKPKFVEAALLADPEMLRAVTNINRQIHDLAVVLNSPSIEGEVVVESSVPEVPIDCMVKRHDGATYIFAVGMRNGKTTGQFRVRGLPAHAKVEVLDEARTVQVNDGRFEDAFEPYAIHIYKVRAN